MSEFEDFDTIGDLPPILARLGPVTGGDILVFRRDVFTDDQCQEIAEFVLDHYTKIAQSSGLDVSGDDAAAAYCPLIVFLPPGGSVEHLSESDMVRAGWQRIPKKETPDA